jgi:hypothetical protein
MRVADSLRLFRRCYMNLQNSTPIYTLLRRVTKPAGMPQLGSGSISFCVLGEIIPSLLPYEWNPLVFFSYGRNAPGGYFLGLPGRKRGLNFPKTDS